MSVQTQIDRISGAVSDALAALTEKGVTVSDGTKVDGLAALIAAIESGGGSGRNVATGTFTPASDIAIDGHTINHGLGEMPEMFIVFNDSMAVSGGTGLSCVLLAPYTAAAGYIVQQSYDTSSYGNAKVYMNVANANTFFTENDVVFQKNSTSTNFTSGVVYNWYAIGLSE